MCINSFEPKCKGGASECQCPPALPFPPSYCVLGTQGLAAGSRTKAGPSLKSQTRENPKRKIRLFSLKPFKKPDQKHTSPGFLFPAEPCTLLY